MRSALSAHPLSLHDQTEFYLVQLLAEGGEHNDPMSHCHRSWLRPKAPSRIREHSCCAKLATRRCTSAASLPRAWRGAWSASSTTCRWAVPRTTAWRTGSRSVGAATRGLRRAGREVPAPRRASELCPTGAGAAGLDQHPAPLRAVAAGPPASTWRDGCAPPV